VKVTDFWEWVKDSLVNIGCWILLPFYLLWEQRPSATRRRRIDDEAFRNWQAGFDGEPGPTDLFIPPSMDNSKAWEKMRKAFDREGQDHGGICGDDRLPPVTREKALEIEARILQSGIADANGGPLLGTRDKLKRD